MCWTQPRPDANASTNSCMIVHTTDSHACTSRPRTHDVVYSNKLLRNHGIAAHPDVQDAGSESTVAESAPSSSPGPPHAHTSPSHPPAMHPHELGLFLTAPSTPRPARPPAWPARRGHASTKNCKRCPDHSFQQRAACCSAVPSHPLVWLNGMRACVRRCSLAWRTGSEEGTNQLCSRDTHRHGSLSRKSGGGATHSFGGSPELLRLSISI
jgi:hypothetical protein